MMKNNMNWYDPNEEVAIIRWCMEDIKILFEQSDIPFTEENCNILLDNRFRRTLEERSTEEGWETMYYILSDCEDKMTKITNPIYKHLLDVLNQDNVDKQYLEELSPLQELMQDLVLKDLDYTQIFVAIKDLSEPAKLKLIDKIDESYFNTAIDREEFESEYVSVVTNILAGRVPVKLENLCIEEVYNEIVDIIINQ